MEMAILPKFILRFFSKDKEAQTHINILLSSFLIFLLSYLAYKIPHFCLFEKILNIPCPGCGVIASINRLRKLNIKGSFMSNPAGILIAAFYAVQIPIRITALIKHQRECILINITKYFEKFIIVSLMLIWALKIIFLRR